MCTLSPQVHGPAQLPKVAFDALDFIAKSDGEASRNRQNYLGRVHYIDAAFGRFVAQLEAKNMYRNSIVAMSADNGGPLGSANNYPLKGGKHSVLHESLVLIAYRILRLLSLQLELQFTHCWTWVVL